MVWRWRCWRVSEPSDPILLSALEHFAFCRRQWALMYLEDQWAENALTADGHVFHDRVHDAEETELRGDVLTVRALQVRSRTMNLAGVCDVVEFHRDPNGVMLHGREGTWLPYPVEYKRGAPGEGDSNEVQLCAQAMCLEEMLQCVIPEGSLFYGKPRRRVKVAFTPALRERVKAVVQEMQQYMVRKHTPAAKPRKACGSCSMAEVCLPSLFKRERAGDYIARHLKEDAP